MGESGRDLSKLGPSGPDGSGVLGGAGEVEAGLRSRGFTGW